MITNALFATTICLLGMLLYGIQEAAFLIPYRQLIWEKYGGLLAAFCGLLFLNLFAFFYLLLRKVFLKDTGQKLAHLEKELRSGGAVSEELARRLED